MKKERAENVYRCVIPLYGTGVCLITARSAKEAKEIFDEGMSDPRIEKLGYNIEREGRPRICIEKNETNLKRSIALKIKLAQKR